MSKSDISVRYAVFTRGVEHAAPAMLILLLVILISLVNSASAEAATAKYISNSSTGGDCASIGIWNPATKTCTLTTDVAATGGNGIEILADGITLDGNGHSVTGSGGYASGGSVSVRSNVTVKNLNISGFMYGVYLMAASNTTLKGNTISGNTYGVYLSLSSGSKIYNNNFSGNTTQAYVSGGSGNVFSQPAPAGGNYWSNYDVPAEGCNDDNGDYLCDAAYVFSGGSDPMAWRSPGQWDITPPPDTSPPVISAVEPSGVVGTSSVTVTISYSDSGSNINLSSVAVMLDGVPLGGCSLSQSGASCPVSGLSLGAHTIGGSVSDNQGNTSTISGGFTYSDTTAPAVDVILPAGTINSTSATIVAYFSDGGSGVSSATAAVYLDGAPVAGCSTSPAGTNCPVTGLGQGAHTIVASVRDVAGNTGQDSAQFVVDSIAPVVSVVQPSGTVATTATMISAAFSDGPGSGIDTASVQVGLDGTPLSGCVATATSVNCPVSGLSLGAHAISGSVNDLAGNTSLIIGSFSFTDTAAPVVTNVLPEGTVSSGAATITASYSDGSGSGIDSASAAVYLDGGIVPGCMAGPAGISCGVSGLADGNHTVVVMVCDLAGNEGSGLGSFVVDTATPPISPTRYIRNNPTGGDCTLIGAWDQYGKTCTLSSDLNFGNHNGIEILSDGITLDGGGHTIAGGGGFATGGSVSLRSNVTVRNLTVKNFSYGIYLIGTGSTTITANTIQGNTYGIYLSLASNTKVYGNNFIGNNTQAVVSGGSGNVFNLGLPYGGNFWSEWTAPDGNADGIVDNPYVFTGGQDNLPWATPRGGLAVGKPALTLKKPAPFWASYTDYLARELSVEWKIANSGSDMAHDVRITGSVNTNGVSVSTTLPVMIGDIAAGAEGIATVKYHVPASVSSWVTTTRASASDGAGTTYTYP